MQTGRGGERGGRKTRAELTFLPSGIALRSTSTLACARTSAEADMLTRKSVTIQSAPNGHPKPPRPPPSYLSIHSSQPFWQARGIALFPPNPWVHTLNGSFSSRGREQSHSTNHEILKRPVRSLSPLAHVISKTRYLGRVVLVTHRFERRCKGRRLAVVVCSRGSRFGPSLLLMWLLLRCEGGGEDILADGHFSGAKA